MSKQTLLTLVTQQVAVGLEQCDLLRGVAAVLRTALVVFAPFPLARTSVVIAAKGGTSSPPSPGRNGYGAT